MGKLYSMSPFEIFKQDLEEVIMLVNYVIEKGEESPDIAVNDDKPKRIKVDDSTASGWW